MMYANSFAITYVMEPILDTMGANFMYFGEAMEFGGTVFVGYSFLYFESLIPPACFMSFNVCMSLFLSLDVGSLLRTTPYLQ